MSKLRNLVFILVFGMLLVCGCKTQTPATTLPVKSAAPAAQDPLTATPEPTLEIDPALLAAVEKCGNIFPGQACLVEGPVQVTAQPERTLMPFHQPGQVINLADLQTLKLGEAGSAKGMVVMLIQTEWSEGAFTAIAFGDVKLVNEVPYGTREYNPLQSLTLTTGENKEDQVPGNGLFVASPEDDNLYTLVVNGLELSFGSGGWLTSQGGGLTVQTMWGSIGAWFQDAVVQVKRGFGIKLTHEEIEREIAKQPYRDPTYERVKRMLAIFAEKEEPYDPTYRTVSGALKKYFGCDDWKTKGRCVDDEDAAADKKKRALEELRKKQKRWKGGWWKMTYGPVTTSGQCNDGAFGDGGSGGDGQPYTTEIPICRGNNGNTILMYESGTSYDRVGPNLYAKSFVTEFDLYGNGDITREGQFMTLQVVSPNRIILNNAGSQGGECTTASTAYLDFMRDDPAIRCGLILYIDPYTTPEPPTPEPTPQNVEPPIEEPYQVRVGMQMNACDPAAKPYAPGFTTAGLSLSQENNLIIDAGSTQYELGLSDLTYPYATMEMEGEQDRLGIFSAHQSLDSSFGLTMSLVQMPDQQYTGNWLVSNEDGSQLCGGSIDLLPPG